MWVHVSWFVCSLSQLSLKEIYLFKTLSKSSSQIQLLKPLPTLQIHAQPLGRQKHLVPQKIVQGPIIIVMFIHNLKVPKNIIDQAQSQNSCREEEISKISGKKWHDSLLGEQFSNQESFKTLIYNTFLKEIAVVFFLQNLSLIFKVPLTFPTGKAFYLVSGRGVSGHV